MRKPLSFPLLHEPVRAAYAARPSLPRRTRRGASLPWPKVVGRGNEAVNPESEAVKSKSEAFNLESEAVSFQNNKHGDRPHYKA